MHGTGPAMVLAGPGSGKTFVITRRIKYLIEEQNVEAKRIAVITFTKAAALEMKERAVSVCPEASAAAFGTFHSFFYQILRSYSKYSSYTIINENQKTRILKQILFTKYSNIQVINQKIPILKSQISYYINTNSIPEDCFDIEEFQWIYKLYKQECLAQGQFDFDLILSECLKLLQTNEVVKNRWQEYFHYFLVDEYQDTNHVQFQILNILAQKHHNIFVVGDDDQSIYGFRGADPKVMFRFLEVYQETTKINLKENFRSKRMILDLSSQSILNNKTRLEKQAYCRSEELGETHIELCKNREEEMEFLVKNITHKIAMGVKEEEIAILCRTTNLFSYISMKLKNAGILVEKHIERNQLYELELVKDIMAYLRFVFRGRKRKDLFCVLNRPERFLNRMFFETEVVNVDEVINKYKNIWSANEKENVIWGVEQSLECSDVYIALQKLKRDIQMLESLDAYGCICYILYGMGYETFCLAGKSELEQEQLREQIEEVKQQAKMYGNVVNWLKTLEYMEVESCKKENSKQETSKKNVDGENSEKGVKLLTYHASKGLEYTCVYIPFLNEYIVPHKKAISTEAIEEERRMFYVAMTRAKDSLTLSYASGSGNNPSMFIKELQKDKQYAITKN